MEIEIQSATLQMRCPNCMKLYSVESSRLSSSDVSKFECVACRTEFLTLKPELHGLQFLDTSVIETQYAPLAELAPERRVNSALEPSVDSFLEPSSNAPAAPRTALVSVPLNSRGVEVRASEEMAMAESAELIAMWDSILADYENLSLHENFVQACFTDGKLAYAAHKYAQILVSAPTEEIGKRMRRRVAGLASYGFDATANGLNFADWKFPLPSFNNFIILTGTIAVVCGLGLPNARQAVGVGLAMIALAIGLRIFLRKPST